MVLHKLYKVIRIILIAVPIVFFIFLVSKDLVISGKLSAAYNFKNPSPFILPLGPMSRVSAIQEDTHGYYQEALDDPIYFDVRLPRQFEKINFLVTYITNSDLPLTLQAFQDKDLWTFDDKPFDSIEDLGGGLQRGSVEFGLTSKKFNGVYQFMISLPKIDGVKDRAKIYKIEMLAERPPLTWKIFLQKVGQRLSQAL